MKVETRFRPNDQVFICSRSHDSLSIYEACIYDVRAVEKVRHRGSKPPEIITEVEYTLCDFDDGYTESELFTTRDEAVATLIDRIYSEHSNWLKNNTAK